jgi:hypothetical protein
LFEFPIGDVAPGSARDSSQLQRAYACAYQFQNGIADVLEHPADDPIAALMDHDPDYGALVSVANRSNDGWRQALAVDDDAAPDPLQHRRRRVPVEQHLVFLVDLEVRMRHPVGDIAIVREQQQTLGRAIEPANRDDWL